MPIACILDSDFEDSEFQQPYDALRQAGHEVVVDGNLVTSRTPDDLEAFTRGSVKLLERVQATAG